jgi:hypothetical protein
MDSIHGNRRWTGGVGMAVSAAFAAAVIGLAGAPTTRADTGPFEDLFGESGINYWTVSADSFLLSSDPTLAASLDTSVDNFLSAAVFSPAFPDGDTPFTFSLFSVDPSAFTLGDTGYAPFDGGGLPDNAIADLAVGLDYTLFATGIGGDDVAISDLLTTIVSIPGYIGGWTFLFELLFAEV